MDQSNKWNNLRELTDKILIILNKAQLQFEERNKTLESGYIQDLRQYCKIVTVCEEQLTLNLVQYNLQFIGDIIKSLGGFHLLILSHLLNWIQKFEFYLSPQEKSTPFEQLLSQSMKHKDKFISIQESEASLNINQLHESIQQLLSNNKNLIDSYQLSNDNGSQEGIEIITNETEKIRVNLRTNSKKNTQIIIQKLLSKQKDNKISQSQQTDLMYQDIQQVESQNIELKALIDQTRFNYENKVKEFKIKYQESKIILKTQKYELDHKVNLLEAQNLVIQQLQQQIKQGPQIPPSPMQKKFIQIPTFEEKNKRVSVSSVEKVVPQSPIKQDSIFSNVKLRSSSLPRISINSEDMMRKSYTKLNFQISKSLMKSQNIAELYKQFNQNLEFKKQLFRVCQQTGLTIPSILNAEVEDDEPITELRIMAFQKLIIVLKEKHQFCGVKCDHINFLY